LAGASTLSAPSIVRVFVDVAFESDGDGDLVETR
jgi:hypothetical protein